MASCRQDTLGVKLKSRDRQLSVLDGHDGSFVCSRGHLEAGGHGRFVGDERMVSAGDQRRVKALENSGLVVVDGASSSVHGLGATDGFSSKGLADGLVAQADSKDWESGVQLPDNLDRTPRLVGRAGTGRDDDGFRSPLGNFVGSDLVVSNQSGFFAHSPDVASEVVDEAVVIIDQ